MRVFMLGWEFPPHISGGLGTACYGMTKGLDEIGVGVCFVLPTAVPVSASSHVEFRSPSNLSEEALAETGEPALEHVEFHKVDATLMPYGTPSGFEQAVRRLEEQQRAMAQSAIEAGMDVEIAKLAFPAGSFVQGTGAHYTGDLMTQVQRYARLTLGLARREKFDVIHAHDWMTYPAGIAAAAATGKPLVIHVHSTEFDRSGENVNQQIYEIERAAIHAANCVICVSHLTRNIVLRRYDAPVKKVKVVYNAIDLPENTDLEMTPIQRDEKIVLFLGRVTMQKGPEYFLQAAKRVIEKYPKVRFVMAGSGDMITRCIRLAADLKIGSHVTFTGFLRGTNVDKVFRMADLYVMPSVSEPFGLAPLEALSHNVPVIISKQSGVSEVLTHALKVDFWDIDEIANKILAVLRHPPLHRTLRDHGHIEMQKFSWTDSARQLNEIYTAVSAKDG
jgi:glycosyltransferase involved in cell wall biosynthesis